MNSGTPVPAVSGRRAGPPAAPSIEASWSRAHAAGVNRTSPRRVVHRVHQTSPLAQAAGALLSSVSAELAGHQVALLLGDRNACVVSVPFADPVIRSALDAFGVEPGLCLSEEIVGTNALGTPVVTRTGQRVEGDEHFSEAFREFSCYGEPILHPVTRRLEGVLTFAGLTKDDQRLMVPFLRRTVRAIEERLQVVSSNSERLLLDAFQCATRSPRRAVVVVGHGMVLATPAALDMLDRADHAALRAYAERPVREDRWSDQLKLVSGCVVDLALRRIDGADGVTIELTPTKREGPPIVGSGVSSPMLVVGEVGSGRTTRAIELAGMEALIVDAAEAMCLGEQAWARQVTAALEHGGSSVVIENVQLLNEGLATLVAGLVSQCEHAVALTSTPGDHLESGHAALVSACATREDLVPLRRRRHEIPAIAQRMLVDARGSSCRRLTSDTLRILSEQAWPGNLAELRRIVRALAERRSTGDIVPSDLPPSHRCPGDPASPLRQAEREIIVAAIDAEGGNKLKAARQLGMSRSTLYNRMRALGIY